MIKYALFQSLLLLITISVVSQDTTIVYFDKDWNAISTKHQASFFRKAFKDSNDNYMVYDYYADSTIQMIAEFKSKKFEKHHGITSYFDESGNKTSGGEYRNGLMEGKWTYWYETGDTMKIGTYKKGQRDGLWQGWHKNGNCEFLGKYVDDNRKGNWKFYYEDGTLEENDEYKLGGVVLLEVYFPNGQLNYTGTKALGRKDGLWTFWNEDGEMQSEISYKFGIKDGLWTRYFDDGKVEAIYLNGFIIGESVGGMIRAKTR